MLNMKLICHEIKKTENLYSLYSSFELFCYSFYFILFFRKLAVMFVSDLFDFLFSCVICSY